MLLSVSGTRAAETVVLLALIFSSTALAAQTSSDAATTEIEASDLWARDRLTGDWGGARAAMQDAGLSLSLTYQHMLQVNMHGGLETKNGHDIGGSYILGLELDFEKMFDLQDATFFMETRGTYGGEADDFDGEKIGGLFRTNQIADTEESIFVNKWWYRQRLADDRIEFRLGVIESFKDLFDINKVAGSDEDQFTNRLLVGNPTIPHANALGAYLNVWPTEWLYVRAMVVDPERSSRTSGFDTGLHDDENVRAFGELGLVPQCDSPNGKLLGHYRFGTWYDPVAKTRFRTTRADSSDVGAYFGFDQVCW
ncbi:MAG: carbohydrate porin, partial [Planctomycetes bacterium]|nr:carbohydrate porin [Planctomycetota bacterium]